MGDGVDHGRVATGGRPVALQAERVGIERRAQTLSRKATPEQAGAIADALDRLTGESDSRRQMGGLFKVMAVTHPDMPDLPGFF